MTAFPAVLDSTVLRQLLVTALAVHPATPAAAKGQVPTRSARLGSIKIGLSRHRAAFALRVAIKMKQDLRRASRAREGEQTLIVDQMPHLSAFHAAQADLLPRTGRLSALHAH